MKLSQLKSLFAQAGCTKLYAKPLAENDNSKNQIYFAGAIETLNIFPSREVFAENTKKGPSFKARLNFGWLQDDGRIAPAPNAQLILYSQYPEVRFSGFLEGCDAGPGYLMADRARAKKFSAEKRRELEGRVLFLGVSSNRQVLGYTASGTSDIVAEFNTLSLPAAFVVFREILLKNALSEDQSRAKLLAELKRVHALGWINSKQLDSSGHLKPCNAPQCGGFTLEAELGIPKNSNAEPDFLGWEVKQHTVSNFDRVEAGTITLMTPEPTGGFYVEKGVQEFVRKYGYPDKKGRLDRLNFGGVHRFGEFHPTTNLKLSITGYNAEQEIITDAQGAVALLDSKERVIASWGFGGLLQHWSKKHAKAVYVPSQKHPGSDRKYCYGPKVRLAVGTNSLLLLKAFAKGAVYYDPGIKLENASSAKPKDKRRSQFRIASKDLGALYKAIDLVRV